MKFEIDKDSISFIKDWSTKELSQGMNFKQLFMLSDNFSVYWLLESYLHTSGSYFKNIRDVMSYYNTQKMVKKSFFKALSVHLFIEARFFVRYLYSKLRPNLDLTKSMTYAFVWGARSNIKSILDKYDTAIIDYPGRRRDLGLDRLKNLNVVAFESFFNLSCLAKTVLDYFRMRKIYKKIRKTKAWQDSFNYKGINMWQDLKPQIDFFFRYRLFFFIKDFHTSRNFINKLNITSRLFMEGEIDPVGRSIISRAKLKSIRTIGIQHGVIQDCYPVYVHPKSDISGEPVDCPLVDYMVVWGEYYKTFLNNNSYGENSLKVLGNPRYDVLGNPNYNKEVFCKEFGLDINKKILCLTTQPHSNQDQNSWVINTVCEAIANKNFELIISPHPTETDTTIYDSIARKHDIKPVYTKGRLFETIFASDFLLTEFSTTGIEAILLNKPLILLDYNNEEDRIPFVEYGVAKKIQRGSEKKLLEYLENFRLTDEKKEGFIRGFCYKNDGLATKRVLELIKNV